MEQAVFHSKDLPQNAHQMTIVLEEFNLQHI